MLLNKIALYKSVRLKIEITGKKSFVIFFVCLLLLYEWIDISHYYYAL